MCAIMEALNTFGIFEISHHLEAISSENIHLHWGGGADTGYGGHFTGLLGGLNETVPFPEVCAAQCWFPRS